MHVQKRYSIQKTRAISVGAERPNRSPHTQKQQQKQQLQRSTIRAKKLSNLFENGILREFFLELIRNTIRALKFLDNLVVTRRKSNLLPPSQLPHAASWAPTVHQQQRHDLFKSGQDRRRGTSAGGAGSEDELEAAPAGAPACSTTAPSSASNSSTKRPSSSSFSFASSSAASSATTMSPS